MALEKMKLFFSFRELPGGAEGPPGSFSLLLFSRQEILRRRNVTRFSRKKEHWRDEVFETFFFPAKDARWREGSGADLLMRERSFGGVFFERDPFFFKEPFSQ